MPTLPALEEFTGDRNKTAAFKYELQALAFVLSVTDTRRHASCPSESGTQFSVASKDRSMFKIQKTLGGADAAQSVEYLLSICKTLG